MQQRRVVKSCPLHVPSTLFVPCASLPLPHLIPSFLRHLLRWPVGPNQLLPSDAFFLPLRPSNAFYSILFFFLFQMVQAIQVLRFHLLELEKVSILCLLCYGAHNVTIVIRIDYLRHLVA